MEEVKPIKVYIQNWILKLVDEYSDKGISFTIVGKELKLNRPCDVIYLYFGYNDKSVIPVTIYIDRNYTTAWGNTPLEVRDGLLSTIDEQLKEFLLSYFYHARRLRHETTCWQQY